LTNGIRHGKATEISIDIFYKNDGIEFKIKDNGVGLEEIAMGNGLGNIEKRIDLVGGRVTFSSRIHEGFSIDAYIPLKEVKTVV
jgi:signal transduction histidine kinase